MASELAHKERPVLRIIAGPVCRHDIDRTRTGAGHAADLRGDQGPDRVGPARPRRPAALHPVPGGGVGRLADDGDGGLRAADRGGVPGDPARSPGAGRAGARLLRRRHRSSPRLRELPDRLSAYGQRLADFAPTARARPGMVRDGLPLRGPGGRRLPPARLEEGGHRRPAARPAAPPLRRPVRLARPPDGPAGLPVASPRAALRAGPDRRGERLAAGHRSLREAAARPGGPGRDGGPGLQPRAPGHSRRPGRR